jgi:hypothetical protein
MEATKKIDISLNRIQSVLLLLLLLISVLCWINSFWKWTAEWNSDHHSIYPWQGACVVIFEIITRSPTDWSIQTKQSWLQILGTDSDNTHRYTCQDWPWVQSVSEPWMHLPLDLRTSNLRIFDTTKNQLISYHWFFMIIICTVIKVLIKTIVYSFLRKFWCLYCNYSNCCTM